MKLGIFAAALLALSAPCAFADAAGGGAYGQPDVAYNILFLKDGKPLAARTVVGQFGREVRVEVADAMRVDVSAQAPDASARSLTSAKMAVFRDGAWQPAKVMTMSATLTMTPSFEYSVEGTPYRFVVMPRRIVKADQP